LPDLHPATIASATRQLFEKLAPVPWLKDFYLAGGTALFTISVPGLEAIVSRELTTDGNGQASFSTMIPAGATPGSGLATVLVAADGEDNTTDRQVLTILE
jgi:hypothetical protein